jgi:hypothetical protein
MSWSARCVLAVVVPVGLVLPVPLAAQLPLSREARIIETVSPTEVLVEATGIFRSEHKDASKGRRDVEAHGVEMATLDARRAAVHVVAVGGTDPLLTTPEEKERFEGTASGFFAAARITGFITFEEQQVLRSLRIDEGRGIKVTRRFKVHKQRLQEALVAEGVTTARQELAEALGLPSVAVLPAVAPGQSPIAVLGSDPVARHAVSVIESFLTARRYDVVVPEQQEQLSLLGDATRLLAGGQDDPAYQLALAIGSDIYITCSAAREGAGYGTARYALQVRAFETTTARLLGTETGYSQARRGEDLVCVEEAVNDALDKVLARLVAFWKEDVTRGVQYRLVVQLGDALDPSGREDVQLATMDAIDRMVRHSKELTVTDRTLDHLVWCDPQRYDRSSRLHRDLDASVSQRCSGVRLRRVMVNRKLLILRAEME